MHTQCAVFALQTPHAVLSSTGGLSALFVAIMVSYVLLNLFFYGSSKSMLKMCYIQYVISYHILVIMFFIYYVAVGLQNGRAKRRDELKNQSKIRSLCRLSFHFL